MYAKVAAVAAALLAAAGAGAAPNAGLAGCTITGTARSETLLGTAGRDVICGLGGHDYIKGFGGNDRLLGGAGDDVIVGADGLDVVLGEAGNDVLDGGDGADTVDGGIGSDRITGGLGRDIHRGGPGADHLAARDGGPDSVDGGPGADSARIDRPYDRLTNVEQQSRSMLRGALAAAVTPLDGDRLDESAFGPYVDFLAESGLDGLLALGTTGEGLLFGLDERKRALEHFVEAAQGRLQVAAHCGAQTTADTLALASHAAEAGVDAVAVIGPPYFQLDERSLLDHFEAAAAACAPLPFYVYEFERASGYAVPVPVLLELRERVPNLAGLKVSDAPFDKFSPYLLEGLDVFVGPEALIFDGICAGAVGAVSGLAAAYPDKVAAVVRDPSEAGAIELGELRAAVERFPRHAALKFILGLRGVPVREDVRRPLRQLSEGEREELRGWLESS